MTALITSAGTSALSAVITMSVIFARLFMYLSPDAICSAASPSARNTALSFLPGDASASALMFLIALMTSIAFSITADSFSNVLLSSYSGQSAAIRNPSLPGRNCQISSVMNGIYGCSSLRRSFRTLTRTALATALSSSSSPYSLPLTISMYQSQYSFQMTSWTFVPAMPNSNLSMSCVTFFTASLTRAIIHLSSSLSFAPERSASLSSLPSSS